MAQTARDIIAAQSRDAAESPSQDLRVEHIRDPRSSIGHILTIVREHLDVDAAFVGHLSSGSIIEESTGDLHASNGHVESGHDGHFEIPVRSSDGCLDGSLRLRVRPGGRAIHREDFRFLNVIAALIADCSQQERLRDDVIVSRRERIRQVVDDRHKLAMVFQPIVHLGTGTVVGCEALSRFHFPPYRTPELWYREAWSVGMGMDLELTALRRAFAAAPELPKNSYLCVNVSPALIGSNALDEAIPEAIASRVVLELTEHTSVDDYTILAEALRTLRRRGIRLAIDDAGAGFSSLRHVLRLTPEFIKLDASLTRSLDLEPKRWALVDSLLGFADRIGAALIAEGIEDPSDMRTLKDIGLKYGQGHILCRPIGPPVPDTVAVD